jgi:photosystem II stability/assembly factor-like uncharacterized protein
MPQLRRPRRQFDAFDHRGVADGTKVGSMQRNKRLPRTVARWANLAIFLSAICCAQAQENSARPSWPDPVGSASEILPRASTALLLDSLFTTTGRIIAVGERGQILISDDAGAGWRQVAVPTRATLTAVAAAAGNVVAVGHDGVIVHSADAGESWHRVREEPYSLDNQVSPSNGSPLLDVLFLDDRRAIAVGAYSLILVSNDGGATWQASPMQLTVSATEEAAAVRPESDATAVDASGAVLFTEDELMLEDEADPHLNAITRLAGGELVIVGERGVVYRSTDEGGRWTRLALPYDGSMFGVLPLAQGGMLVYGLRGRVFESMDAGDHWREIDSGTQATLFAGAIGGDGAITLVGNQGTIVRRSAGSATFAVDTFVAASGETPALAGVLPSADGKWLLVGERGVAAWERQP